MSSNIQGETFNMTSKSYITLNQMSKSNGEYSRSSKTIQKNLSEVNLISNKIAEISFVQVQQGTFGEVTITHTKANKASPSLQHSQLSGESNGVQAVDETFELQYQSIDWKIKADNSIISKRHHADYLTRVKSLQG